MEIAERIAFLLNDMNLSMPTQDINQSTNEILAALQEANGVEIFNHIITTNQNPKVRKSSYVYLRKIALANKTKQFAFTYKDIFLHYFEIEKCYENFDSIIYMIEPIAHKMFKHGIWSELSQVGFSLIQNPQTALYGLHFFTNLFSDLPEDDQNSSYETLYKLSLEYATSQDMQYRIAAYNLLATLIFFAADSEAVPGKIKTDEEEDAAGEVILKKFPDITQVLLQIYVNALSLNQNPEITEINNLITCLIFDRFDCFEEFASEVFNYAIQASKDETTPITTRLNIFSILNDGPTFYPDYFTENIEDVFTTAITLSVTSCSENREDTEFLDVNALVDRLSTLDSENLYEIALNIANELSQGDDAQVQVCLYMLSWIAKGRMDDIGDDPEPIINPVSFGLQSEDDLIAYGAKTLLEEVMKVLGSAIAPYFDDLVSILIQRATDGNYLSTLERVLFESTKPYAQIVDLVTFCLQIASDENTEYVDNSIECIANALSKYEGVEESFFDEIYPVISNLLNDLTNGQVVTSVFRCISSLTKVSPQKVSENVLDIVQFMMTVMDQEEVNIPACSAIADTLKTLISMYMSSFVDNSGELAQRLLNLLKVEIPEHEINMDDDDEGPSEQEIEERDLMEKQIATMRQSSIVSLSMMIQVIPNSIEDYIPSIIDHLSQMIVSPLYVEQMSASIGFKHAFPNILNYGFDTKSFVLLTLIPIIKEQFSELAAAQLFRLLCHVLSLSPCTFTQEIGKELNEFFVECLRGKIPVIGGPNKLKNVEDTILPPLVECIHIYILMMEGELADKLETLYPEIARMVGGRVNGIKGYGIRLMATLTTNFSEITEIFDNASQFALQGLTSSNAILKENSFRALGFLIPANPEKFSQQIEEILQTVTNTVLEEANDKVYQAALAAYCTINAVFNINQKIEDIDAAFSKLQFRGSKSSDCVVAYAKYVCFCENKGLRLNKRALIAAIILSMSELELARLGPERLEIIKNIMRQNQNQIDSLTKMNQKKARIIKSKLE
ncbi:hypothetical protein TVAG_205330 [Trichomonas vaginalis G3]|uniref:Importin N-terminal domain-containing protein n=1 Tax=Trichomonas vaginalis (strain ATCC PRA-98 / G3) TaxID=412133 RepID=A2FFR3_TRIV3|nr:armadillo (ARM) repeat-containing protein family [Trichomonas vaginalis G3]EAX96247.1 hypothetical protein TVAG_205330 [Trichomonas vaginalis G3]KAI5516245.1 armadillo (ARM) repeat-containing protein family [Trichomonas vaginalis G3]|eukprot:XP_001309177.1 hypothetical protein [Trichomonas vaginalis G3]